VSVAGVGEAGWCARLGRAAAQAARPGLRRGWQQCSAVGWGGRRRVAARFRGPIGRASRAVRAVLFFVRDEAGDHGMACLNRPFAACGGQCSLLCEHSSYLLQRNYLLLSRLTRDGRSPLSFPERSRDHISIGMLILHRARASDRRPVA
jgi:hypothetical protein